MATSATVGDGSVVAAESLEHPLVPAARQRSQRFDSHPGVRITEPSNQDC